ncbi:MAG: hypothetical protein KBT48_05255 [Firmicutes bacterium]|nr:hypothetical protein [Bacillota bacterium]
MAFVHEKDRIHFKKEQCFYSGMKEDTLLISKGKCEDGSVPEKIRRGILVHIEPNECAMIVKNNKIYELTTNSGDYKYEGYMNPTYICDGLDSSSEQSLEAHKVKFNFSSGNEERELLYFNISTREVTNDLLEKITMEIQEKKVDIYIQVGYSYKLNNPVRFFEFMEGKINEELDYGEFEAILQTYLCSMVTQILKSMNEKGELQSCIENHFEELQDPLQTLFAQVFSNMGIQLIKVEIEDSNVMGYSMTREVEPETKKIVLSLDGSWTCSCGCTNTTNFCGNCGAKRPD